MRTAIRPADTITTVATFAALIGLAEPGRAGSKESKPRKGTIEIRNPKVLTSPIPCERIALGKQGDYKPCIAKLPDGELLVVAFDAVKRVSGKKQEDMLLWRSKDGGRSWSPRKVIPLLGREPYFSVLRDGTLFISVHFLKQDIRNREGYVYSMLHRSTDGGRTWQTTKIGWEDVPGATEKASIATSRNVLELKDGTLIFGVGAPHGHEYLWRSRDKGKTWDKTLKCTYQGFEAHGKYPWSVLQEAVYWQAPIGDILALCRVAPKYFPPLPGTDIPKETLDQFERMVLYRSKDGGRNWSLEEPGSHYGEMYPSILRLKDGRLLLTFTLRAAVRPNVKPLGVRAVVGRQTQNGFAFDFRHDRIMLDTQTPVDSISGGGFGPTVQSGDGTLVTSYSYVGPGGWRGHDFRIEVVRWRLPE